MHVWGGHTQSFFSACRMSWALTALALLWIFKEPIYYWPACCGCGFLFGFFLVPCCLSVSVTKPHLCAFMSSHSSFYSPAAIGLIGCFEKLHKTWHSCSDACRKGGGGMGRKDGGQPEMSGRVDSNRGDREGQLGWKWRAQCIRMTDVWVHIGTWVNKDICERWDWSHYWQTDLKHAQQYFTNLFFSLHRISWTFWWILEAVTLLSGRRLIPICEDTTAAHCE